MMMRTETARAKVNLFLHVTGRRGDGYHTLQSLAVFPDCADTLSARPAAEFSLHIMGKYGAPLQQDLENNLILKAAQLLQKEAGITGGAAIALEKNLPVASGIGGGSADAGATLRLLQAVWQLPQNFPLENVARQLGADVPLCLHQRPMIAKGIGHELTPVALAGQLHLVLANPGIPVATKDVFALLKAPYAPAQNLPVKWNDGKDFLQWLNEQRNDLQPVAIRLVPEIGQVLEALSGIPDCRLARMSGSGATCFGLFDAPEKARDAARHIQAAHSGWWCVAATAGCEVAHG